MNKITIEVKYNEMLFELVKEVGELRMFFSKEQDCCIIVDKFDNVLFDIIVKNGEKMWWN